MDWPRIEPDLRGEMPATNRLNVVRSHLLIQNLARLCPQHGNFRGRFIAYEACIRRELIVCLSPTVIFALVIDILKWGPSGFELYLYLLKISFDTRRIPYVEILANTEFCDILCRVLHLFPYLIEILVQWLCPATRISF